MQFTKPHSVEQRMQDVFLGQAKETMQKCLAMLGIFGGFFVTPQQLTKKFRRWGT